jgi:hypothetical protein
MRINVDRDPRSVHSALAQWREERLVAAGFDRALARQAAADGRFDVHALIELTETGCPPHLAYRILAPLQEGP